MSFAFDQSDEVQLLRARCEAAEAQLDVLTRKLAVAECMVDTLGHPIKSPCGHCSSLSWTDGGGKHIRCLLCTEARLLARISELEGQAAVLAEKVAARSRLSAATSVTDKVRSEAARDMRADMYGENGNG